jgi:hypothetical protein
MNHEKTSAGSYNNNTPEIIRVNLPAAKLFNKDKHLKTCKYRNEKGLCTRSQHLCPATLFTITFNN